MRLSVTFKESSAETAFSAIERTVMVQLPAESAVTLPLLSTDAIFSSELSHTTSLFSASSGVNKAFKASVSPYFNSVFPFSIASAVKEDFVGAWVGGCVAGSVADCVA